MGNGSHHQDWTGFFVWSELENQSGISVHFIWERLCYKQCQWFNLLDLSFSTPARLIRLCNVMVTSAGSEVRLTSLGTLPLRNYLLLHKCSLSEPVSMAINGNNKSTYLASFGNKAYKTLRHGKHKALSRCYLRWLLWWLLGFSETAATAWSVFSWLLFPNTSHGLGCVSSTPFLLTVLAWEHNGAPQVTLA